MHIPKHFAVTDKNAIYAFIKQNAFGQLISNCKGRIFSSHIPLLLTEDKSRLVGHLGINNPQVEGIQGQEVLVTFQGPHDYISPSWYKKRGVPTWNYQVVHIYGRCEVFTEPDTLRTAVEDLTAKYESHLSRPWQPDYNATMLKAIVGFEVLVDDIQCQFKLSQNRSAAEREEIITQLRVLGSNQLADAMSRNEL